MHRRSFLSLASGVCAAGVLRPLLQAQIPTHGIMTPVLTRGYTNARTGANLNEKVLTVANVKQRGLKQYFQLPLEGDARGCEAQPLILPNIPIADDNTHDVLIACSMNGTVWCFDANDSADLWMKKIGYPVKGGPTIDMYGINDHWSILSSPVADPDTNKLYLVAWISQDGTPQKAHHEIIEMDIRNGDILKRTNLDGLTYDPGHGLPIQTWKSPTMRKQRSSLLLTNVNGVKTVFFASGSVLETSKGAAGWVIAYDCGSSQVCATLCLASRGYGAGVWMAGQGIAADSQGRLFLVTGNGSFDAITDWAESCLELQFTPRPGTNEATLTVVNNFTPYSDAGRIGKSLTLFSPQEQAISPHKLSGMSAPSVEATQHPVNKMPEMDMADAKHIGPRMMMNPQAASGAYADQDLGSAGACLIEKYESVIFAGKDGIGYVGNMNDLGHTQLSDLANPASNYQKLKSLPVWLTYYPGANVSPTPQDSSDLDFLFANRTHHMHSTPVAYDSANHGMMLFCAGENGNVRAWMMDASGKMTYLACSQEFASPNAPVPSGGMPGMFLALSANGQKAGTALLWACCPVGDANKTVTQGHLYCYDATNLGRYADGSGSLSLLWQSPAFTYAKFVPPVISGGRVFVTTYDDRILCYGLN